MVEKTQKIIMSNLRKATRKKAKIRLGLSAVSGAGKTYSAILIASGLCGDISKVAIIDTENSSADLYAHLGDYNVLPLTAPFSPEKYIAAIKECEDAGMEVIIIDSITHEWDGQGGVMDLVDQIGGGFSVAWKQMGPRHEKFKQSIIQSSCHIITTVRRKQEYVLQEEVNKQGRVVQKPVKAGMKEVTREGWEYELTINLEIDQRHNATASKDRTGLFMGKPAFIPSKETGEMIREWCESGIDPMEEIKDAISKLDKCDTIEDMSLLKETLPQYVLNSDEWKKAGADKYNKLKTNKNAITPGA